MKTILKLSDNILVKSISIISIIIALYIFTNPISTPGGELLFLLPFSFFICTIVFPKLILYQKNGWGLKIFYIVIIIRYLLVPFLTCTQGVFATGGLSCYSLTKISAPESYRYALIAMVLELFTSLFIINKYYEKTFNKMHRKEMLKGITYESLGFVGLSITLFFIYLIVSRGGIENFVRLGVVTENLNEDNQTGHHGIDVEIIKPLLGFLIITITGFFRKRYDKYNNIIFFIIPMVLAFFSCILIVGNNRMQMVYLALCAIAVLSKAFPNYSRGVKTIILPTLFVILVSFTLLKQFGISVDSGGVGDLDNDNTIIGLTEYVCGPENTAHTFDNSLNRSQYVSLSTFCADVLKFNHSLRLPILNEIVKPVATEKTVIDYAVDAFEMISVAGQCSFYGHGAWGGWILTVISFIIIARCLVIFEVKSKITEDLGTIYVYNWCAILFGVSMCYCLVTLWDNITYVPLWIWVLLKLNKIGQKTNKKI